MKIKSAANETDFINCFEVMKALRPHHTVESYLAAIYQMQKEGYQLIFLEDNDKVVSVAGFRFTTTLYDGLVIDFDDFVTVEDGRSKGYGATVFDHLVAIAKEKRIKAIHLNSAHHRYDAHRFYLNKKMNIIAHHFRVDL